MRLIVMAHVSFLMVTAIFIFVTSHQRSTAFWETWMQTPSHPLKPLLLCYTVLSEIWILSWNVPVGDVEQFSPHPSALNVNGPSFTTRSKTSKSNACQPTLKCQKIVPTVLRYKRDACHWNGGTILWARAIANLIIIHSRLFRVLQYGDDYGFKHSFLKCCQ